MVPDIQSAECPVSLVTPEAIEWVELFHRIRRARESTGASLYGPELAQWPARTVDAFNFMEAERVKIEQALMDAETSERDAA